MGIAKGYDVEHVEPADAKAQRRERRQKQSGTDQPRSLAGCCQPGMVPAGKIPGHQVVVFQHAQRSEQKPEEPEQGARVAKTQIHVSKCGQQQRSQDESRNLVIIGHREPKVS